MARPRIFSPQSIARYIRAELDRLSVEYQSLQILGQLATASGDIATLSVIPTNAIALRAEARGLYKLAAAYNIKVSYPSYLE